MGASASTASAMSDATPNNEAAIAEARAQKSLRQLDNNLELCVEKSVRDIIGESESEKILKVVSDDDSCCHEPKRTFQRKKMRISAVLHG